MSYFQFESDFVDSLQCIPMQVRMKLDNCGIKLKLVHWNQFDRSQRQQLIDLPCQTDTQTKAYRKFLQNLVVEKTGQPAKELAIDPHPPWLDETNVPDDVLAKAEECQVNISSQHWSSLSDAQRFALIKLSRPSHENKNFIPALQEFGIIESD